MAGQRNREPVEIWLTEPGELRSPFAYQSQPLEYLPPDAPLPQVGDLLLLPRNITGDTPEQAFAYAGRLAPFRVQDREHVYYRDEAERLDPANVKPARHVKTVICVQRLTPQQFYADRGWRPESED